MTPSPVVVVHVLGALDRGGAETVALDLCRAVPAAAVEQTFVCLSGREGTLAPRFRELGARVVAMRVHPLPTLPFRLSSLLRTIHPDVLQSHVSLASGYILALGALVGVNRRIALFHSEGDGRPNRLPRKAYRAVSRTLVRLVSTHIVGVSKASLDFGLGPAGRPRRIGAPVVMVLPNGVDTERYHPADADPVGVPIVLHVGRAAPEKNRRILPDIHRLLTQRQPHRMILIGPGGAADLAGLDVGSIELVGDSDEVAGYMRSAAALVLPSTREGLPGVVLEALASGVPVVATDLPGLRELRDSLPSITLVPAKAPVTDWVDALAAAARLPAADRVAISEGLRRTHFTLTANASGWQELWGARPC